MTTLKTANQEFRYPDQNSYVKYTWQYIRDLALDAETRVVGVYDTQSALASKVTAPTDGTFAYIKAGKILQFYNGSTWVQIYPPTPQLLTGTAAPTGALGNVGDFYFQT